MSYILIDKKYIHRIIGSVLAVMLSFSGFSQTFQRAVIHNEDWKKSSKSNFLTNEISREVLIQLDSTYKDAPSAYSFLMDSKGSIYVFVQCTFDFYLLEENKLHKIYKFNNRGYTCGATPFQRDGRFFLLGGSGFWKNHSDLMKFDSLYGSWELVKTEYQPDDYLPLGVFQNSKGITALFGDHYNPRNSIRNTEEMGYFLDWKTQEWSPISIEIEGVDLAYLRENYSTDFLETEHFVFLASNTELKNLGWNIIDKETGEIFVYPDTRNFEVFSSPYIEIFGDLVSYMDPKGKEMQIDLGQIQKASLKVGQINYEVSSSSPQNKNLIVYVFGVVALFIIVLAAIGIKNILGKKSRPMILPENEEVDISSEVISELLTKEGEKLTTESLDLILKIDHTQNFDSRRIKRSRLINEINQEYKKMKNKELIVRERNPNDKRFFFYMINS